jgi:transcriptional regulator with XRE-family HTH domain
MEQNIAEKMIIIRTALNLSQKEFAEKINISFRNLQNYETGTTLTIPHSVISQIIQILEVNPYWLLTEHADVPIFTNMKDNLDFIIEDFLALYGNREEVYRVLKETLIQKILDRLNSLSGFGVFQTILDYSLTALGDALRARPFLFFYYIFQIIKNEDDKIIQNYKSYIIGKIQSYEVFSIDNQPFFTEIIKKEFIELIELKMTEKECKFLVEQTLSVLKSLESRMPNSLVKLHRNAIKKKT